MDTKETARAYFDRLTRDRDLSACDDLLAAGYVDHDSPPGTPPGPGATKLFLESFLAHHPDLRVEIDDILGEGDRVALRLRWHSPVNDYHQHGIVLLRFDVDGRIAERWSAYMPA